MLFAENNLVLEKIDQDFAAAFLRGEIEREIDIYASVFANKYLGPRLPFGPTADGLSYGRWPGDQTCVEKHLNDLSIIYERIRAGIWRREESNGEAQMKRGWR